MSKSKNLTALVLAFAMVATLFSVSALAVSVDSDPYMTAYDGLFTVVVDIADINEGADLLVVPADSNYNATYFSTQAAAANVQWSLVGTTGGLSGIELNGNPVAEGILTGGWLSDQKVSIPSGSTPGSASFVALNPISNASVNITLVVTDESDDDPIGTIVKSVIYQVFEPRSSGITILHSATLPTIDASKNPDERSYVTVADGLGQSATDGLINSYFASNGYLVSLTINGVTYTASGDNGWQYAVYTLSADGSTYNLHKASLALSAGDYSLATDQLVQWRFGTLSEVSFPTSFPNPYIF